MPRGRLRANYSVILKLSFTHVLPVSTWCLAFIPSCPPQWRCCKNGFCNTSIFFRRVVSSKMTGHFLKNDKSLFENDKSLFENDRSFLHNRRVVFMNTWGVWKSHRRKHKRIPRISFVKIPIFTLPHARTRTRTLQEFSLFCCHKCHKIFTTYYFSEY